MPKVSIVLCSYNGEQFIAQQIQSILLQTFEDFECVICDDNSTDNTLNIVKEFEERDSRVKVYSSNKNVGYIKNFEKAIGYASGQFIALSDQDDWWEENKIQLLLDNIFEFDLIYSNSIFVNKELEPLGKTFKTKKNMITSHDPLHLVIDNCVSGHASLFKKELYQKSYPFPNLIPHDWWLAYNALLNNGIKYIDKDLVKYRVHGNNAIVASKNKKSKKAKSAERHLRVSKFYEQCPSHFSRKKDILGRLSVAYEDFSLRNNVNRVVLFMKYKKDLLKLSKRKGFSELIFILKMFTKLK